MSYLEKVLKLHEEASTPEIRAEKQRKAEEQGSKTSKSKRTMSKFMRKSLGKQYKKDPEGVAANERALAAGRRFARGGKPELAEDPTTKEEALVYAMNRWATHLAEAAMLGENQFASRPGGDGTGRQKGAEAVVAAEKKKEQKPSREAMPKTAGGLRRLIRQGR